MASNFFPLWDKIKILYNGHFFYWPWTSKILSQILIWNAHSRHSPPPCTKNLKLIFKFTTLFNFPNLKDWHSKLCFAQTPDLETDPIYESASSHLWPLKYCWYRYQQISPYNYRRNSRCQISNFGWSDLTFIYL